MLHTISMKLVHWVRRKDILKGFYNIWASQPSWSCDMYHGKYLHFIVPKSVQKNVVKDGSVVSGISKFYFLYVNDLGPRSRNNIEQ